MFWRTIVQSINVAFELTTVSFNEVVERSISESFKEIIKIATICFKSLFCFLQPCLGNEEIASDFICCNTGTPLGSLSFRVKVGGG